MGEIVDVIQLDHLKVHDLNAQSCRQGGLHRYGVGEDIWLDPVEC
jgi:hypothetical protein